MQAGEEKIYDALKSDLAKTFALDNLKADFDVENFFEQIEKKLSELILDLIQKDHIKLLAILYRIDVDEKTVRECLGSADIFTASDCLAKAVIERQIKKIKFRMNG